jgi:MFS family permease
MRNDVPQASANRSLRQNRDYMGWWTSNTVSVLGTSVSTLAFPLLVLYTDRSAALAGIIMAANMVGTLATTLVGGALADRVSRKALLIGSPLVQAAALGFVALSVSDHHSPIPLLAACSLVSGMAAGIVAGATNPALRRIVRKDQLPAATSLEMGRDAAAELIGSPLSGILFSAGHAFPFLADAVSFLFASLGGALIRRPLGPDRGDSRSSVVADIRDGIRLVGRIPFLRFVVVWGSLLNVIAQGFVLLFIALVRHRGGSPTVVGVVSSVALVGGVAGAVIAPIALQRMQPRRLIYLAAWIFVAALGGVAVVPRPWQIGAVLLVAMLAMVPLNVVLESYVVRLVPDKYSGRVSAVTRFGGQGLQWTGPLLAGLLADTLGASGGTLVFMALTVPLAVVLHFTPALAVLDQPSELVPEISVDQSSSELESRT